MHPPEYLKSPISTTLVAVIAVFESLATCIVAARFYLRLKLKQGVKWDDYLALLSLVASWAYAIGILVVAREIGVDWVKIDPFRAAQKFVEAVALGSLFLIFVIAPIKVSVLLFYNRIFGTGSRKFNIAVWVAVGIIVAWGVACFVCQMLIGDPDPKSLWEGLAAPKYRFDYFKFGLSVPVISIILDGLILLFPLPSLRKLHLPMKKKISVLGIFWLGAFCLVTGAVRIYYWYKNADALTDASNVNVNKWRYDTLVQVWVFLEMTVSIIAACLPTLAPILTSRVYGSLAERLSSLSYFFRRTGSQGSANRGKGSSKGEADFQRFGSLEHKKYGSGDLPVIRDTSTDVGYDWDDENSHLDTTDIELGPIGRNQVLVTTK